MDISRRVRKVFIGNIPRDAPEMTPEYLLAFFTEVNPNPNPDPNPNRDPNLTLTPTRP